MNFLLLSCPSGEGHNSARRAIAEELDRQGVAYTMADPVSFQSERAQRMAAGAYNSLIRRSPRAFGLLYRAGALYSGTHLRSPVYFANAHYSESLYTYILENRFDAVISTHLFGMEALTAIRRRQKVAFPSFGVLTDYTCIPFLREVELDLCFVPHEEVRQELIRKGVPASTVEVSGIPVSAQLRARIDRAQAREQLGLPRDRKVYLILTGGVGCGHVCVLCDELLRIGGEDGFVCVLTGRNETLRGQLQARFGSNAPFQAIPFTEQVPLYMRAADAVISKPGGLSSTEAAVANVPLVHFGAIPGCETKNAAFFSRHGLSLWGKQEREAIAYAAQLAHDPVQAEEMRKNQREVLSPYGAETILRRITETLGKTDGKENTEP